MKFECASFMLKYIIIIKHFKGNEKTQVPIKFYNYFVH